MIRKRPGLIKYVGVERTVVGDDIQAGHKAPDFLIQKKRLVAEQDIQANQAQGTDDCVPTF